MNTKAKGSRNECNAKRILEQQAACLVSHDKSGTLDDRLSVVDAVSANMSNSMDTKQPKAVRSSTIGRPVRPCGCAGP